MGITFYQNSKTFNISTKNSSYIMGLIADGILTHIYYGARIENEVNLTDSFNFRLRKGHSIDYDFDKYFDLSLTGLYQEYPTFGNGDYRTPALKVEHKDGKKLTKLLYKSHKIVVGKPALCGLPAVYTENDSEAETLLITLRDAYSDLEVILSYSILHDFDAIFRSAKIINNGNASVKLLSALSASLDFDNRDFELTYLQGTWARERHITKTLISGGNISIDSKRGASSHILNPFVTINKVDATETAGEVFGYSLVYSGNFIMGVDCDEDSVRAYMGINPFDFCWILNAGESFQTPEVVMVYSDSGFGKMSRTYHKLYRTRLCRGAFRDTKRPVLINNWEATYYDFDEEKIVNIAKKAKECGVELMVVDDGWFGNRDTDRRALGDWIPNQRRFPNGIGSLAEKLNNMGMKLGLWFEPEMISTDSDLYRAHPDWCLHVEGANRSESRFQLVLDLSRKDVCDYIIEAVSNVLNSANIEYVKWDMNRNMSEVGSALLDGDHQSEIPHRYILGLYNILEVLTAKFPNILFESCAGGGGRFDPAMMYYMPQAWTSDDSDAVERLYIQYGTSLCYPSSMMGAHVSAVPNHQVGRTTPIEMRGLCASCGRLGYELDLATLNNEEIAAVKKQIEIYHEYEDIIHKGDMYRIASPFESNMAAFQFVSETKDTVLVFYFNIKGEPSRPPYALKLQGLESDAIYKNDENGEKYQGAQLTQMGILMPRNADCISKLICFKKIG